MSARVWTCECKNSVLSTRESQTVENCIRNVSTDLRLSSLLIVLTLLVCLSCFCRANLRFVLCFPHFDRNVHAVFPATCFVKVDVLSIRVGLYQSEWCLPPLWMLWDSSSTYEAWETSWMTCQLWSPLFCLFFFLFVWAPFLLSPHSFPPFPVESWFECNTESGI